MLPDPHHAHEARFMAEEDRRDARMLEEERVSRRVYAQVMTPGLPDTDDVLETICNSEALQRTFAAALDASLTDQAEAGRLILQLRDTIAQQYAHDAAQRVA